MAMFYMDSVHYNKPTQPTLSRGSRNKKRNIKKSANRPSMSGKSVIMLTDSTIGQDRVTDDDDFVDPPPRHQESPPHGKSHIDEGPSAIPLYPNEPQSEGIHSPNEPQYEGTHRDDVSQLLHFPKFGHISLFQVT